MALYRNITDRAAYICSNMNKVLVQPGKTVELASRDLIHAGYALVNFESVAKAKEVEEKRMAELERIKRFTPQRLPKIEVPTQVISAPIEEAVAQIKESKKSKKEKYAKRESYEVSRESLVSEIESDLEKEVSLVQEKVEPMIETEDQTI